MRYTELSSKQLEELNIFVQILDDSGWEEAKKWFEYYKKTTSENDFMTVNPPSVARLYTDKVIMELKYEVEDGWLQARKNDANWNHPDNSDKNLDTKADPQYLFFTIGERNSDTHLNFRLVYNSIKEVLTTITMFQDLVSFDNFQKAFLPLLAPDCDEIYLENGYYTLSENGKNVLNKEFELIKLWPPTKEQLEKMKANID